MTRVLHLIGTSEIGGTERFLSRLAGRTDRASFAHGIAVLDRPGRLAGAYADVADPVVHLGSRRVLPGARLVRWRGLLGSWRPDVLVLYGFRANLLGRLCSGGTPIVAALRSLYVDEGGRGWAAWLDRCTFDRVSVCVSNSRAALRALAGRGYPEDRLAYVPAGVDTDALAGIDRTAARRRFALPDDLPVLVCVANLKPVKAHDLLLQASARVKSAGLRHRLWLVGEGPERRRLEALSDDLGLGDTVVFLGAEDDVGPRLCAADVAVLASRWEGMPTALLEAMATGLPVVASSVGEIPDLVADGRSGRLVPPGDAAALADALASLIRDPALRRAWGRCAREAARAFSLSHVTRQYEFIFRWAAERRHPSELWSQVETGGRAQKAG